MEPVRSDLPVRPPDKYDAAIFFDNDPNQIKNVRSFCQTIRTVKVQHTDNLLRLNIPYNPRVLEDYKSSLQKSQLNHYINYLEKTHRGLYYDPLSGLSDSDFDILEEWINTLRNAEQVKYKAAIFDWDRTLSKFEGVALGFTEDFDFYSNVLKLPESLTEDQMMEDMLIYICGGPRRLADLRDMFMKLSSNNIDIIILTNNGGCPKPGFKLMIDTLLPEGIQAYLACSSKAKFDGAKGHKGYKLYTIPQFKEESGRSGEDICSIPSNSNSNNSNSNNTRKGGKRRSKRRKRTRRRGKTRKNYL